MIQISNRWHFLNFRRVFNLLSFDVYLSESIFINLIPSLPQKNKELEKENSPLKMQLAYLIKEN